MLVAAVPRSRLGQRREDAQHAGLRAVGSAEHAHGYTVRGHRVRHVCGVLGDEAAVVHLDERAHLEAIGGRGGGGDGLLTTAMFG